MIFEASPSVAPSGPRRHLPGWLHRLLGSFSKGPDQPTVVFCYGLFEGETLEDWCRRNPGLAPSPEAQRVVWILPDTRLPPTETRASRKAC